MLYPSQQEILDETNGKNRVAYYLGCGAGKTYIGSEKLMSFGKDYNLVICQKSKVQDWVNHFQENYPHMNVWDMTAGGKDAPFMPGVTVINYDLAFRRPILLKQKDFALLLDESSLIQNSGAKRTKFILKMKPSNVVLLSGTPVSAGQLDKEKGLIFGKYENLISQLNLLGWNISKKDFWARYCNWELREYGSKKFPEVVSYKNITELNARLKTLGAVFRKTSDIVDLPEYDDQTFYTKVTPQYRKMQKEGIVEINGDLLVGDIPLTKMLRLRQLCGAYNPEKESVLKDLLESLENERVIVFYNFKDELEVIKKAVGDRPFYQINGDVKDWDERTWTNEFNAVVAAQYQSGSHGHNMQAAKYIIYMSPTNSAELFEQSRGRIRRNGQKAERVMYYHIICRNSVEERILSKVRRGVDYTLDDYIAEYERTDEL